MALPKLPLFILAPMDDVTDTVFRQIISSCASPDLCFSEFVNVEGLMSDGRKRLLRKLERSKDEPPLIAHLWGLNPDDFEEIADQVASGKLAKEIGLEDNFGGIDLNMGCPVRAVTRMGACSALMNNRDLAQDIIESTKKGAKGRLPISVKTRLGYSEIDPSWTQFLFSQNLDMLSIHLRTVKEMSLTNAHHEELERIKQERDSLSRGTLLIANGDILSRGQGDKLINKYGIDGVMIGRGVFHDPYAFSKESPWPKFTARERAELFMTHLKLYESWADKPNKGVSRLNKYAKIYINGFDGAKELRTELALAHSVQQMLDRTGAFLQQA